MIDTHCHLEMKPFDTDRQEVIKRAKEAGLEAIITIGSDLFGNKKAVEISQQYDYVYATVGFHPHDAKDFNYETFELVKSLSKKDKVIAIGEIGLDYHYNNSPRNVQIEVFKDQLNFAKEIDYPVVIHSREAKSDTLSILKETGHYKGVMHCFSGDKDMAKKVIDMGFFISLAGPVTYKNATKLQDIARYIPDEFLLLETDAPYLAPEPLRGKRNEPAFIFHTARFVAKLRQISEDDIVRITSLNAKKLFRLGNSTEGVFAYKIRDSLYLNITNRCTNECSFCVRFHTDYVKGHNLKLQREPSEIELIKAIGDPTNYKEIVFCGYGEPTLRLDLIKKVAKWIKEKNGFVRINTNGHGNLINKRNILPELKGLVDSVSVSLNAQNEEIYNKVCKPIFKNAFEEVINFIKEAKKYIPHVQITVVTLAEVELKKCQEIAKELGVPIRFRHLDIVG
ncbi:MAG: YchF/TatD family DNA exonuclease [Thermodesulfovibrionales bacterium]|nr:YchF/TatD family DNA exonuclease [Thermodesulfovibrionales bacterium]